MIRYPVLATLCVALASTAADARDRTVMLTSFDRIRVEGPFDVTLTTGSGAGGRISGASQAIDGVNVRVEGRTLIVSAGVNGWGGYPGGARGGPVRIAVTTPSLRAAYVAGGGRLTVDRIKAQAIDLAVSGAGSLSVAAIESDQLVAALNGTGTLSVAGSAGRARFVNSGTGAINAGNLVARDLVVVAQGAGSGVFAARYTADISALGLGDISVEGSPKCVVRGAGPVNCGDRRAQ